MRITEIFSAKAVASHWTETASNRIPYLGLGFFPEKKKMGLDLKWIKGHKGLPVSLAPSNFDAKSTLRSHVALKYTETELPYIRQSLPAKKADEQEIMRVQDANDPYAADVISRIFDDTDTLLAGAEVVAERMRMQLLCPEDGSPKIHIAANGVQYAYNYDADGSYQEKNFLELATDEDKWSDHENSNPIADITHGLDAVEAETGVRPSIALVSRTTFNHIKANAKVRSAVLAQNATANVLMNDARVKELFKTELGVTLVVYTKQYLDEEGIAHKFYLDGFCTLLPEGALGNTWRGVTPEERTLLGNAQADVSVVSNGVAVTVTVTSDPVNTKTTVSEIVLPSFERMAETYVIKAY